MDIAKGAGSLGVLWSHSYDEQGVVYGTSPATSTDGQYIYVSSSNYNLVCFTKLGERTWGFDCGQNNEPNRGSDYQHPTPTVDSDGTVYVAVGDNTTKAGADASSLPVSMLLKAVQTVVRRCGLQRLVQNRVCVLSVLRLSRINM